MPRDLTFYGASDDLFEIEGTKGDEPDEIGAYDSGNAVASPTGIAYQTLVKKSVCRQ